MSGKLDRSVWPEIRRMHLEEGQTFPMIARRYGVTSARVGQIIRELGVSSEQTRLATRPTRRTGRKRITPSGHVVVYMPEHHRASISGHVYEHIIIAEKAMNRQITRAEHVHHINGDPADNRPENLRALSPREHHWIHQAADPARLIAELRALGSRLGRTPTASDMRASENCASPTTYYKHFGSLRAAQEAAGMAANSPSLWRKAS